MPKKVKKSGAPGKKSRWAESTSNKIPDPQIVFKQKKVKLAPMRTVKSGVDAYGKVTKTVKSKTRKSL